MILEYKKKNEYIILFINYVNFVLNMIVIREEILIGYIVYKIIWSVFYLLIIVWINEVLYKFKWYFGIEYSFVYFW